MQLFAISFELGGNRDMDTWYKGLPPKGISSFLQLVGAFCDQWDPNTMEEILKIIKDDHTNINEQVS